MSVEDYITLKNVAGYAEEYSEELGPESSSLFCQSGVNTSVKALGLKDLGGFSHASKPRMWIQRLQLIWQVLKDAVEPQMAAGSSQT